MNFLLTILLCPLVIIYIPLGHVTNVLAARGRLRKWSNSENLSRRESVDSFHSAKSHFSSSSGESIYETPHSSLRRGSSSSRTSSRRSSGSSSSGFSSRISSGSISSIFSDKKSSSGRFSGSFDKKSSSNSFTGSSIIKSSGTISYPIDRANSNSFSSKRNKGVSVCNSWGNIRHHRFSSDGANFYLKYRGFSIESYLSKSSFSNRIYNNVWSDCNYQCYWKNNYEEYKSRVIANINLLRLAHRSGILKYNDNLDDMAQSHANLMAKRCTLFSQPSDMYGIVVGMSYYPAASVIVTKWYDENRKYNYLSNRPQPGTQMFTQLIWESAASIGVGVARSGEYLFVACYFYPKGNIKGQYRKNISRRRSRWHLGK